MRLSVAIAALALAAGYAHAQTTHVVTLQGTSFSPGDLTIQVGDSVQWDWISGLHNVESGVNGIHDGNFRSGDPGGLRSPGVTSIRRDTPQGRHAARSH